MRSWQPSRPCTGARSLWLALDRNFDLAALLAIAGTFAFRRASVCLGTSADKRRFSSRCIAGMRRFSASSRSIT